MPPATSNLLSASKGKLTSIERLQVRAVRSTFEPGAIDQTLRWCQQHLGAQWIHGATKHLRSVHHYDRVPIFSSEQSFILVSNHRSFFDLYVTTCELIRRGMSQRIVFPVRSKFFYDNPLGFLVNGVMSFFAMYPPIFREPSRAALNLRGLDEVATLLNRGGTFVGIHPEGTRNRGADPYQLLPAQSGVGRLIRHAQVPVIPVFTNGLLPEGLVEQLRGNWSGTGQTINIVFGHPIDFGDLLTRPTSPRLYREISALTLTEIAALGEEERQIRATQSR